MNGQTFGQTPVGGPLPPGGPPPVGPPGGPQNTPGWNALLRPGAVGPGLGDYDWTGLNHTEHYVFAPEHPGDNPSPGRDYAYFGNESYAYFGPIGILSSDFNVTSNPSTYKWRWHSPLRPSDHTEDDSDFPAPPFYVLESVRSTSWVRAYGAAFAYGTVGVEGNGWLYAADDKHTLRVDGVAGSAEGHYDQARLMAHRITQAGVGLMPQAHVEITPTMTGHGESIPDESVNPTGDGGFTSSIGSAGYPLILLQPDPFAAPFLGDGSSQIVYKDYGNSSYLFVPVLASAVGAYPDDMQWLLSTDKVGWSFHDYAPDGSGGAFPNNGDTAMLGYTKQAAGDAIYPVSISPDPVYSNGYVIFKNLPDDDSGFGYKEVRLMVEGHTSQKAVIQTFFPATGKNHPDPDGKPNWYYYYNQLVHSDVSYSDEDRYGYVSPDPWQIDANGYAVRPLDHCTYTGPFICNRAYQSSFAPAFTLNLVENKLACYGAVGLRGLLLYLWIVGHELGHADDLDTGRLNPKLNPFQATDRFNPNRNATNPYWVLDRDGDGVPNAVEIDNNLDPDDADTTEFYLNTPQHEVGDAEVLANIHALKYFLDHDPDTLWRKDWCDAGLNAQGLDDSAWGKHNAIGASYFGDPQPLYCPYDYADDRNAIPLHGWEPPALWTSGTQYLGLYHYPFITGDARKEVYGTF